MSKLPMIRHSERVDYKRCPKKWFWRWRMGLVPRLKTFGALELGTWVHYAFADWYTGDRQRDLARLFAKYAEESIEQAVNANAPQHVLDKADELFALGEAMMGAYQRFYGIDENVHVLAAEIPLEFQITDDNGELVAIHKLKPDLVFADQYDYVWLMEHKTAAQIRLEHLPIDDQARPYVAMAERSLRNAGVINKHQHFKGVMYNFARKALPDERAVDAEGRSLNKNGTVSKRQPTPVFVRHPVTLSRAAKVIALRRLQLEARIITAMTAELRNKRINPDNLPKTPHSSCPKLCPFFTMCVAEEQGGDIKEMQRSMFVRRDPYEYEEETTDIPLSFELS